MTNHHVAVRLHTLRIDTHVALVHLLTQVFTLALIAELVLAAQLESVLIA